MDAEKTTYKVLETITVDEVTYEAGATIELSDEAAQPFEADGKIEVAAADEDAG